MGPRADSREPGCNPEFPTFARLQHILGKDSDAYAMVATPEHPDSFRVEVDPPWFQRKWVTLSNTDMEEYKRIWDKGTPILGVLELDFKHIPGEGGSHALAYLVQPTQRKLWIFETYDLSADLKIDDAWTQSLNIATKTDSFERIYPSGGVDLQAQDDPEKGRCISWALIVLDHLKKLDLKSVTRDDLQTMMDAIAEKSQTTQGYRQLHAIVYGARRQKRTLKAKRKHRKLKTRRHGPTV